VVHRFVHGSGAAPTIARVAERIVMFNLRAVQQVHVFEAARSMVEQEHHGPAVVVAQAAIEVAVETCVYFAMQMRDVYEPIQEWIDQRSTITSWSPDGNPRVQRLWTALTGDRITTAPGWTAYAEGLKARHRFVHRAGIVTREQAEGFIAAAEQVVGHLVDVMHTTFPDPLERP
jgi:hypothetical protein